MIGIVFCLSSEINAQVNASPFYFKNTNKSISLKFDNDTYYYTDYYYTYGLQIELVLPVFSKSALGIMFPKITDEALNTVGVSLSQKLYTPKNIHDTTIQFNDRPFAATVILSHFWYSRSLSSGIELSSAIKIGVIGPAAGGKILQQKIHEWINSPEPLGWDYQIANDLILNYDFHFFYPIIYHDSFKFGMTTKARIGTLFDDLSAGINFAFAKNQFSNGESKNKKLIFAVNSDAAVKTVLYNATLQGGMFSRENHYTLSRTELSPLVFSANISLSVKYYGFCLRVEHDFLTKEFKSGQNHNYAGISMGYSF